MLTNASLVSRVVIQVERKFDREIRRRLDDTLVRRSRISGERYRGYSIEAVDRRFKQTSGIMVISRSNEALVLT